MSHGYISSRGVFGNQICNELLLRSLFQHGPFTTDYITMHDLVHDLAQSIMANKVPGVQVEGQVTSTSYTKIRQINLSQKFVAFPRSTLHNNMDMSSILTNFNHLRALDARGRRIIINLPSTVGNLKHLRLLNLFGSLIRTLPNSLCTLWNLQILDLDHCPMLVALPSKMRYLKNLRHLCMEQCISLRRMPSKLGELTCLKTLSLFIVGYERGKQLEELQCLNLGGRLEIKQLERVGGCKDAKKANLAEKKDLRSLCLTWESYSSESSSDIDEKVLEALQPHPNLEIKGFNGRCFPVWMTDSVLKKIVRIDIVDSPHCLHLPELGKLSHLEFLKLKNMGVEYIIEDENAIDTLFPSLKTLNLCSLPNLKGVLKEQVSINVFPNLRKLKMYSCSSITLPQLSSLKELDIQNCGGLMPTSVAKLDALTSLTVGFGKNMKCLPLAMLEKLTNLESLGVVGAEEELPEEGLQALKSLTKLSIQSSVTLTCLPVGWLRHLNALKSLSVKDCPELVPEEIKDLNRLEFVLLENVAKMVCLPRALRHLSSVKVLHLIGLHQLNSLPDWLGDLTSLTTLHILYCHKLLSLPASIRGLPNLQTLLIGDAQKWKGKLREEVERIGTTSPIFPTSESFRSDYQRNFTSEDVYAFILDDMNLLFVRRA